MAVTLWDIRKLKPVRLSPVLNLKDELAFNKYNKHGLALSVDGAYVAAGMYGYFRVWDVLSGDFISEFAASGWVDDLVFGPTGRHIFAPDRNRIVRWKIAPGGDSATYDAHSASVSAIDASTDGRLLISGGFDHLVYVWDVRRQRTIHELRGHESWIVSVRCTRDGQRALSASSERTLALWDLESGTLLRRIDCGAQLIGAARPGR